MEEKKYNKRLLSTLRIMFANSLYNQKISQNASNRSRFHSTWLFWISVLLLSFYLFINLSSINISDIIMVSDNAVSIIKVIFGMAGIVLVIIRYWGQFELKRIGHENAAKSYRKVRDNLLLLIGDYMSSSISESEMIQKRDIIKKEIDVIDCYALSTSKYDYNKAQKDLRGKTYKGEHFTFSDEEIDRYLPKEMRVTQ